MAGLRFGQYFSQYDAREISAAGAPNPQTTTYYTVGYNDQKASLRVGLAYEEFVPQGKSSHDYLAWVKAMTRRGHAVTITVFMNHYLFYGMTDPSAGERDYDHIVSVSSIQVMILSSCD